MLRNAFLIPAGIAAGLLMVSAPALWSRFRSAARIARGLRAEQRADAVDERETGAWDARFGRLDPARDVLDEQTWDDLHLGDVFARIDRCVSQPGRQYLYHLLRRPSLDAETLTDFDARVRSIARDGTVAARIGDALASLRGRHAVRLEAALFGAVPARPAFWWLFPALTASSVLTLAAAFVWPAALVIWLGLCVMNMLAQATFRPRVAGFTPALREMPTFIDACRRLGASGLPAFDAECLVLRDGAVRMARVRRTTRWLTLHGSLSNELAASLFEYANLLFLLDLTSYVLTVSQLRAERATAQAMFRALGSLDAMRSVAAWRESVPEWCVPRLDADAKTLMADHLVHPLLDDGVANSLHVRETSVLVTGSNMSGKTTFLRAVGVNAVLARAVGTVLASEWSSPTLRVRSALAQHDSLRDGKSYYMAEIESVKRMLDAKTDTSPHLFLVDELYRGTNTPERIAAGFATLAWLDRGHDIVLVATHDLELHTMLRERFVAYHFREEVRAGALTFDFRMRPGVSSTRNAIALLRLTGYPEGLVAAASAALPSDGGATTPGAH